MRPLLVVLIVALVSIALIGIALAGSLAIVYLLSLAAL